MRHDAMLDECRELIQNEAQYRKLRAECYAAYRNLFTKLLQEHRMLLSDYIDRVAAKQAYVEEYFYYRGNMNAYKM